MKVATTVRIVRTQKNEAQGLAFCFEWAARYAAGQQPRQRVYSPLASGWNTIAATFISFSTPLGCSTFTS
ncbi:hypothetical protein BamMEX5DRAFT_6103 [Burkholderia ambifaria MEX-5]|uniref:Uncharacterized protein n=1 Tax=Burkholderia ambifaria MEX-5 TaxID=396597 RepID=B1TE87_9BURK|nr:hypothetical protein BamMEX5DRAFT_6103 [Burkholderia ambifaria MEX-5]